MAARSTRCRSTCCHEMGETPSLPEAILNTFQIMEKSIIRAKLQTCQPDILIEVDLVDVRLLEFYKAHQVFAQSMRVKDAFKRELESRLAEHV